jgi:hypothetical protein
MSSCLNHSSLIAIYIVLVHPVLKSPPSSLSCQLGLFPRVLCLLIPKEFSNSYSLIVPMIACSKFMTSKCLLCHIPVAPDWPLLAPHFLWGLFFGAVWPWGFVNCRATWDTFDSAITDCQSSNSLTWIVYTHNNICCNSHQYFGHAELLKPLNIPCLAPALFVKNINKHLYIFYVVVQTVTFSMKFFHPSKS